MTITLDSAAALLNTHKTVWASQIKQKTRQGLEFESFLPFAAGEEYYSAGTAVPGEVLQPYQGGFTPKGTVTVSENSYKIRPIKVDLQWSETDLEVWYASWFVNWFEAGKDPQEFSFPRYIYDTVLQPKMLEELNTVSWSGVYAAPTAGTAGAAAGAVNGFAKVIADAITATTIPAANVIAITAPTATNIREMVEQFLAGIPTTLTSKGGQVLMSVANQRNYIYDYRGEFMHTNSLYQPDGGPRDPMVDGYNISLKAVNAMGSSNRFIFLPNNHDNLKVITRRDYPVYPDLQFFRQPRTLQVTGTFYRAYGFENGLDLYVNDKA